MSKKILIVDASADMLGLLHVYLARADCAVFTTTDETEGFHRARTEQPDLIIVGINSSKKDGIPLIEIVRAMPELAEIPIIAIVAVGAEVVDAAGATVILRKPFTATSLLEEVKTLLQST